MARPEPDALWRPALTAALLAGLLGFLVACSTKIENLGENIPADWGGLPANTPNRPADPILYPAVHDMPPPRPLPPLDETAQKQMELDLMAARDRQEGRDSAAKKPVVPAQ